MTTTGKQRDKVGSPPDMLTQDQIARLVLAMVLGRGEEGIEEDEIKAALAHANGIKLLSMSIDMVFEGRFGIDYRDDDLFFRNVDSEYREQFEEGMRRSREAARKTSGRSN